MHTYPHICIRIIGIKINMLLSMYMPCNCYLDKGKYIFYHPRRLIPCHVQMITANPYSGSNYYFKNWHVKIHHWNMYNSVVFSRFTRLYNNYHSPEHFHHPPKRNFISVSNNSPLSPVPSPWKESFCPYRFANSGHFI